MGYIAPDAVSFDVDKQSSACSVLGMSARASMAMARAKTLKQVRN